MGCMIKCCREDETFTRKDETTPKNQTMRTDMLRRSERTLLANPPYQLCVIYMSLASSGSATCLPSSLGMGCFPPPTSTA